MGKNEEALSEIRTHISFFTFTYVFNWGNDGNANLITSFFLFLQNGWKVYPSYYMQIWIISMINRKVLNPSFKTRLTSICGHLPLAMYLGLGCVVVISQPLRTCFMAVWPTAKRTLAVGARNGSTQKLGKFEKRQSLTDRGQEKSLNLETGDTDSKQFLHQLKNTTLRLPDVRPVQRRVNSNKVNGIILWPRVWLFPFLCHHLFFRLCLS